MITKSFKDWDSEDVERAFGIKRVRNLPALLDWTKKEDEQKIEIAKSIEELREKLLENADAWNEDELKMFFIAPLLNIINFEHQPYYKAFTQRVLSIKTDKVDTKGEVEFMVATGRKRPYQPFFFLHEYKQEENRTNDATGQLLIGMVAAQMSNEDRFPIYGCYVLGRFWFFMVLDEHEYSVSNAYNATEDDIYLILDFLKKAKMRIEKYFNLI